MVHSATSVGNLPLFARVTEVETLRSHGHACLFRVVVGLQIDPALRIGAKENAQTQCRVYSDTAQAFDNFMDAPG